MLALARYFFFFRFANRASIDFRPGDGVIVVGASDFGEITTGLEAPEEGLVASTIPDEK